MGLTIHYSLQLRTRSPTKARQLVDQLRQKAIDLPFQEVGEVADFRDADADFDQIEGDHPYRWLLIQAARHVESGDDYLHVKPVRVLGFSTFPGPGSEEANFGLAVFPKTVEVEDQTRWPRRMRRLPTGLSDWSWSSFCKTEYASNPKHGGIENFLRCHLAVIKLLDQAAKLGIVKNVDDEGDFWQTRDIAALAKQVGDWNSVSPGWADRLNAAFGEDWGPETHSELAANV